MQDDALCPFHLEVWCYLNDTIPGRWIGRGGEQDLVHHLWPPRSPDLTPCDFYLWGYIKEKVFVPPMPAALIDFVEALNSINSNQWIRVWQEMVYCFGVCRTTNGTHVECIRSLEL